MHSTQVTAGQRLRPLLNHCHHGPKLAIHEVILESSCTMRYLRTPQHRTLHRLQQPGELHHISGRPSPYLVNPPPNWCLWSYWSSHTSRRREKKVDKYCSGILSKENKFLLYCPLYVKNQEKYTKTPWL